ncbi:MAG TPA: nucleotidyltransferase domain-containing protein [Steroidobacteraceae bacterium]
MESRLREAWAGGPVAAIAAVYLFGSHARGTAHAESDIDVAILLDGAVYPTRAARFEVRLQVIAHLADRLGAPTDVIVLNDAPPLLGREVITEGVPVVVADAALDHAYRRDVQLRAADLAPFIDRHRRRLAAQLAS